MSQRRRRGRSRRAGRGGAGGWTMLGIAAAVLFCAGVIGGVAWLWATAPTQARLSEVDLCPVDGPRSLTVALIDASDAISPAGRRQALIALSDLAESVPEHGLLELRVLRPGADAGEVAFSMCNPGDGSRLDPLTANPERARLRWLAQYRTPLEAALETGLAPSEAATSPIMATVQGIALERFTGAAVDGTPKRLVIVSDMMEHGADYSHYRERPDFERFTGSPAHRRFRTDLRGADVEVLYVQRHRPNFDEGAHIRFWEEWFSDSRGALVRAERLQG